MDNKNLDIYKYCYDFWKQCNWNTAKLIGIKNAVGIKDDEVATKVIRKYAKIYATDCLKISDDDFYTEIESHKGDRGSGRRTKSNYFKLFEMLSDINLDEQDKIIEILNKVDSSILSKFKNKIADYVILYRKNEPNLVKDLGDKINFYSQVKKNEKADALKIAKFEEDKKNLDVARDFINSYIDSDCNSKEQFCNSVKLPILEFNKYLKIVENFDPDMFKLYREKSKGNTSRHYNLLIKDVKNVIDSLSDDGFNLVDYYMLTNSHFDSLNDFWKICKDAKSKNIISNKDFTGVKRFLDKNGLYDSISRQYNMKEININQIMNTDNVIGMKSDKYGNIIEGSGHVVTDEEKKLAIKFLSDNNIPISHKTYSIARDKVLSEKEDSKFTNNKSKKK